MQRPIQISGTLEKIYIYITQRVFHKVLDGFLHEIGLSLSIYGGWRTLFKMVRCRIAAENLVNALLWRCCFKKCKNKSKTQNNNVALRCIPKRKKTVRCNLLVSEPSSCWIHLVGPMNLTGKILNFTSRVIYFLGVIP